MRIVIVEDEMLIREGIVRLACRINPEYVFVGEAANGREGLEMILTQCPDLVITDIRMPDMDGLEMLEKVREQGCSCNAIVLTAYSEFSYAQQAVRLGVIEYLLKPIVMDDFIQALRRAERVSRQAVADGVKHPEALRSLRAIYRAALDGMPMDHDLRAYLDHEYAIDADGLFTLILLYPGEDANDGERDAAHELKRRLCQLHGDKARLLDLPEERVLAIVDAASADGLKPILAEVLQPTRRIAGYTECRKLSSLRGTARAVSGRLDLAVATGERFLDMRALPDEGNYRAMVYPLNVEQRARAALWARDAARVEREFGAFFNLAFSPAEPYRPREIKECFVRLLWALVSDAAESGCICKGSPDRQSLLERAMSAVTREELYTVRDMLLQGLCAPESAPQVQPGETVARARAMIHEYYTTGITLEEIAEKLKVTPEYLSQQFHKEMGVNYSMYIRTLRVEKAKELLRTTGLKVYEVAQRVGYMDPKYFARVFKAETGRMPCGYRTHT